jgi:serine/threonine-protein phosphatase PP1 catalytic subunit
VNVNVEFPQKQKNDFCFFWVEDAICRQKKKKKKKKKRREQTLLTIHSLPTKTKTTEVVCLLDPISNIRIKVATKGTGCAHAQCFDRDTYLRFYIDEAKRLGIAPVKAKWKCPVCRVRVSVDDFVYPAGFQKCLDHTDDSVNRVRLDVNAQVWSVITPVKEATIIISDLLPELAPPASPAVTSKVSSVPGSPASHGTDDDATASASASETVSLTKSTSSSSASRIKLAKKAAGKSGLDMQQLTALIVAATNAFKADSMCVKVKAPVNVIGDLHGQFEDLAALLKEGGLPPNTSYVFLGDYIDRGQRSIDTIALLFALKIKYPKQIVLLRGNHEEAAINRIYGFFDECKRRFSVRLWRQFCNSFNWMPVAAVIDDAVFCVHGGISPQLFDLDKIGSIQRPCEIAGEGLLTDLLWSDPDASVERWAPNGDRGVSFLFGEAALESFLKQNDLQMCVRAHQVVEDGYEFFASRRLVTVFSAANYGGEFDNDGAMLRVDADLKCSFFIRHGKKSDDDSDSASTSERKRVKKRVKSVAKAKDLANKAKADDDNDNDSDSDDTLNGGDQPKDAPAVAKASSSSSTASSSPTVKKVKKKKAASSDKEKD